jgi:hypothetical protein
VKLVINKCFGGYGLSEEAVRLYAKKKDWGVRVNNAASCTYLTLIHGGIAGFACEETSVDDIERNDPILVAVVEELGCKAASGDFASLKIVEIPDDVQWELDDYDGQECIHEIHRSWE